MSPETTLYGAARRELGLTLRNAALTLAAGGLAVLTVLVAAIVLLTPIADADLPRSTTVAIAALLLCAAILRAASRRYAAIWRREPLRIHIAEAPPACRSHDGHRPGQRDRRDPAVGPCEASRCRPRSTSRSARDVGCRAAARPLERRGARRRTRS